MLSIKLERLTEWSAFFFIFAPRKIEAMKKFLLHILLLFSGLVVCLHHAEAQRFIGFVAAGANFSQIEGDDLHGFTKVGANAGVGLKLPVNRKQNMFITLELLYSQKGSYKKNVPQAFFDTIADAVIAPNVPFKKTFCKIDLDYVQIPLMFRYEDMRTGVTFGAGFSWSRLVRARELYKGYTYTTDARSGTYHTSDWSFLADVDIRLYKNLSLAVRWEISMVPIRNLQVGFVMDQNNIEWEPRKMRNHLLSARLCYYINEKYEKNTKTNAKGNRVGPNWIRVIPDYD